ncbi:retrovirus-related pol polyprotein from transposon TNT 1-94 [Tanacetum coccineum]
MLSPMDWNALQDFFCSFSPLKIDFCGLGSRVGVDAVYLRYWIRRIGVSWSKCRHGYARHVRESIWYLENRCPGSMTSVKSYSHKYVKQPRPKAVFGDNSLCITEAYGSINCGGIVFSKVAFVNGLKYNLISISQLCDAKYIIQFDDKQGGQENNTKLVNIIGDPGEGMLTRSMAARLKAASTSECFFTDILYKIEPKKEEKPSLGSKWVFKNKKDEQGNIIRNKARLESIGIFLAYATCMIFIVYQMDVKSAFLNGKLKEEVYVQKPSGFESSEHPDYVCKLEKSLYRLKQAPRACALVKTPMVPPNNIGPSLSGKLVNKTLYRGMIGSLMYLTISRPYIQFLTCLCARYQANPKESHLIAMKRIFRYLKGTPTLGLWYPKCSGFDLKRYSDSEYDGCNMDRKSRSGACQLLGGKLVCWTTKNQQSVAMSSAKDEYVAATRCYANILWMKSKLNDYDIQYKTVPIFCNNTSAIAISNNPVLHLRTKHIDIRYHFIRYHIIKGDIKLYFIPTSYQLADIFKKPPNEPTFTRLEA